MADKSDISNSSFQAFQIKVNKQTEIAIASEEAIAQVKEQNVREYETLLRKQNKEIYNDVEKREKALAAYKKKLDQQNSAEHAKIVKAAQAKENLRIKTLAGKEKAEALKSQVAARQAMLKRYEAEEEQLKKLRKIKESDTKLSKEEQAELNKQIKELEKSQKAASNNKAALVAANAADQKQLDDMPDFRTVKDKAAESAAALAEAMDNYQKVLEQNSELLLDSTVADDKTRKKMAKENENKAKKDLINAKKDDKLKQAAVALEEKQNARKMKAIDKAADLEAAKALVTTSEGRELLKGELKEGALDSLDKSIAKMKDNLGKAVTEFTNSINQNVDEIFKNQGKLEARLQGTGDSYSEFIKTGKKAIGVNALVSQRDYATNLQKLIESGVDYNVELRAYLATVSENIAHTFDAFDSNLLRLIRLQQKDSTTARLGMEAKLNELLNTMFSDSGYLGSESSGAYDNVSKAITDASAMLTHDMAVEFEFVLQKWLGSLYSVGASDELINMIAEGVNAVATGNIERLSGNDQLQTLFAMGAQYSGEQYADMLTQGLDASSVNKLMRGMVTYLGEIAQNTGSNRVTRSAYSNVFGVSTSDLTAISNLDSKSIENIFNSMLAYSDAVENTQSQLSKVGSRIHNSQKISTLIDNAQLGAAINIGANQGVYATWQVLDIVEKLTGGIPIPSILGMGTGLILPDTVTGIAKAGIAGLSLMSELLGSVSNIGKGLPGLDAFGGSESITRGTIFDMNYKGKIKQGISTSGSVTNISNSDSSALVTNTLQQNAQTAKDLAATQGYDEDAAKEDQDVQKQYFRDGIEFFKFVTDTLTSIDTFENLQTQVFLAANSAQIPPLALAQEALENKLTSPDGALKVQITDIADPASTILSTVMTQSLAAAITNELEIESSPEPAPSVLSQLKSSLNGVEVKVTNEHIDEVLQKMMFGG